MPNGDHDEIDDTDRSELEKLPPELLMLMFAMLKPQDLLALRKTSKYLKACVDSYVAHLMEVGAFMTTEGKNLTHFRAEVTPSQVIILWGNGSLLVTPTGLTVGQILDTFDKFFVGDAGSLIKELWRLVKYGKAEGLGDSLLIYVRQLMDRGRLVAADGQVLRAATTPAEAALLAWRKSDATWYPPR